MGLKNFLYTQFISKRRAVWVKWKRSSSLEIVRLARREMRNKVPLGREVRSLKSAVSQLRKTVSGLQRLVARQAKEMGGEKIPLEATPEEAEGVPLFPRLIRSLRKRLGVTQKGLAAPAKVTVGAIYQCERNL